MLLLSSKIAPGLLVALHLKVSTLFLLLLPPLSSLPSLQLGPSGSCFLKKVLDLCFKETDFSKTEALVLMVSLRWSPCSLGGR